MVYDTNAHVRTHARTHTPAHTRPHTHARKHMHIQNANKRSDFEGYCADTYNLLSSLSLNSVQHVRLINQ